MDIFVFSSKNLTNIWAGIGAKLWAVSETDSPATRAGRQTKSLGMHIGSFGILYCSETQSLTTPFIVYSKPSPTEEIDFVWPERWILPFRIFPLGTPERQMHKDVAKRILPIFTNSGETNFGKIFHVQAITAFSPTQVGIADWEILITQLAAGLER